MGTLGDMIAANQSSRLGKQWRPRRHNRKHISAIRLAGLQSCHGEAYLMKIQHAL